MLGAILAGVYAYLGASALPLPHHAGSWGAAGGAFALLAAGAYACTVTRRGGAAGDRKRIVAPGPGVGRTGGDAAPVPVTWDVHPAVPRR